MKKLILTSIALVTLCMVFNSCGKDDPVTPEDTVNDLITGSYEIFIDGSLYGQGSAANVGLIMDNNGNYVNNLSLSDDGVSILVYAFPTNIGASIEMEMDNEPGLSIIGTKTYGTISGTLTRESETKISFVGKCTEMFQAEEHTVSGVVETDALKKLN